MKYFCVEAVFYHCKRFSRDGARIIKTKSCKAKPKNQLGQANGITTFTLWLSSEERAKELCDGVNSGEFYIDDLITLYEDSLSSEGRAA